MKAQIETVGKRVILTVFYDPATCDWNEAITTGLASYGLAEGKVKVIAVPSKTLHSPEQQRELF